PEPRLKADRTLARPVVTSVPRRSGMCAAIPKCCGHGPPLHGRRAAVCPANARISRGRRDDAAPTPWLWRWRYESLYPPPCLLQAMRSRSRLLSPARRRADSAWISDSDLRSKASRFTERKAYEVCHYSTTWLRAPLVSTSTGTQPVVAR